MRRRTFLACLVLQTLLLTSAGHAQGAGSGGDLSRARVFALLDGGNPETLLSVSTKRLMGLLKKGRPYGAAETGKFRNELVDGHGRKTQLFLSVPREPKGAIIVLHGLGGSGRQLRGLYASFAEKEGLIIAAPTAQREPEDARNDDWVKVRRRERHWWSYGPDGFVLTALKALKRDYPIDQNRVYLSGYSMGGFGAWNLGLRYPDRWAAIVPYAGGLSRLEYGMPVPRTRRLLFNAGNLRWYFIHGGRDRTVPPRFDRRSHEELERLGYEHRYVEVAEGRHVLNLRRGSELMRGVESWLAPLRRDPHPRVVKHRSLGPEMSQAYWIRIAEMKGDVATVTAAVKTGNHIEATTEGVEKLTVFLDPELVDLSKPITVTLNGKRGFSGKVQESTATLIESWRAREDRHLLYPAAIELSPHSR